MITYDGIIITDRSADANSDQRLRQEADTRYNQQDQHGAAEIDLAHPAVESNTGQRSEQHCGRAQPRELLRASVDLPKREEVWNGIPSRHHQNHSSAGGSTSIRTICPVPGVATAPKFDT